MNFDGTVSIPPSMVRPTGMTRQEWRRKNRELRTATTTDRFGRIKQEIPTIVMVDCPNCNKHRLGKYLGEDSKALPVSKETINVRGETRLVDVCDVCLYHFREKDKRFVMDNLRKIQQAMRNRKIDQKSGEDFTVDL